jgi:excisionase family DNA binding protein
MDILEQIENWPGRYMTVEELADIIGKSVKTIYRYINTRKLRSTKIGNEHRLNPRHVADWLRSMES